MFKIAEERTFTHRVRVQVPVDGGHREEPFKVTYRVIEQAKVDDFDLAKTEDQDDFMRSVIVGMDDLADANGQPLPYSDDVRDQVIRIPYARLPLIRGYFEGIGRGARKGN